MTWGKRSHQGEEGVGRKKRFDRRKVKRRQYFRINFLKRSQNPVRLLCYVLTRILKEPCITDLG